MNASRIILDRARAHAYSSLTRSPHLKTNLYIDQRVYDAGELIGPHFQQAAVTQPSILVFADDEPLANFAHPCRYMLYDAQTGDFQREIAARFPPYTHKPPETLEPFHESVRFESPAQKFRVRPIRRCPVILPEGNRYAILYAGMSNMRHLNDLEFCYRMLIDRYAFHPHNIFVYSYDGTLNTQDGPAGTWPGDGTPYRIHVNGAGNRAGLESAFGVLKSKLREEDLLFIHTNNHGDNDSGGSFLCEYPSWGKYYATDCCNQLHALPRYRSLLVMMEQCNSGGFNVPVIESSTARHTSIASAAIATQSSYASPDGHWDSFARDWIAAQVGHDPYGAALAHNPDTNGNGVIEADEAFAYALSVQNPSDTPNHQDSRDGGGAISLDQRHHLHWLWCDILHPIMERQVELLGPEASSDFEATLRRAAPELQRLLLPMFDRVEADLRKEVGPRVEAILAAARGDKGA